MKRTPRTGSDGEVDAAGAAVEVVDVGEQLVRAATVGRVRVVAQGWMTRTVRPSARVEHRLAAVEVAPPDEVGLVEVSDGGAGRSRVSQALAGRTLAARDAVPLLSA